MSQDRDPFYIGWMDDAPPQVAAFLKKFITLLILIALGIGASFVLTQQGYGPAVFEFGEVREFTGVISEKPYPTLAVDRPGQNGGKSRYYLVKFGKFGGGEATAGLDGKQVRLKGSLIYRDDQTMIEIAPDTIEVIGDGEVVNVQDQPFQSLPFRGEIVDSKCFLGVMNPGDTKVHKACAIRCIAGGVPPLLVSRSQGEVHYFLLTGPEGAPINKDVLDLVAVPVMVHGNLRVVDGLNILETGPDFIIRTDSRMEYMETK